MNKEETMKHLEEAQKLPHATVEDLRRLPEGISEDKLAEYLEKFLKPTGSCWLCEKDLYIQWGLQHGEAHCTNCGMDVRVYHFLENKEGEKIRFDGSLQYHPKNYSLNK